MDRYTTTTDTYHPSNNIAMGYDALLKDGSGANNIAIGNKSIELNISGDDNIGIGVSALNNNIGGAANIGIGNNAMLTNDHGYDNIAIGLNSLKYMKPVLYPESPIRPEDVSSQNIAIGNYSMTGEDSNGSPIQFYGSNCTCIGYKSQPSLWDNCHNEIVLGNNTIEALYCAQTSISSLSDERDKKDITNLIQGLDFINTLQPRQFTWNRRVGSGYKQNKESVGFIAQEMLASTEGSNHILDLVNIRNPEKLEIKQSNLIPIIVNSIKDLSLKITDIMNRLEQLENK